MRHRSSPGPLIVRPTRWLDTFGTKLKVTAIFVNGTISFPSDFESRFRCDQGRRGLLSHPLSDHRDELLTLLSEQGNCGELQSAAASSTPPADPLFKVSANVDYAGALGASATLNIWFGIGAPASRFVIPAAAEPGRAE